MRRFSPRERRFSAGVCGWIVQVPNNAHPGATPCSGMHIGREIQRHPAGHEITVIWSYQAARDSPQPGRLATGLGTGIAIERPLQCDIGSAEATEGDKVL